MTCEEREALQQTSTKNSVETTVNYFKKKIFHQRCIKKVFTIWKQQESVTKCLATQIIQEKNLSTIDVLYVKVI